MAGSLNRVQLIGNLGADPEVRRLNSGDPVVNLSIATSETWRDKNSGERRERTEWHRVVIFNKPLAEVAEQYLKKGSKVFVEGKLATRSWEDQSGQKKYTTEVVLQAFNGTLVMLGDGGGRGPRSEDDYGSTRSRGSGGSPTEEELRRRTEEASQRNSRQSSESDFARDMEDEIPF